MDSIGKLVLFKDVVEMGGFTVAARKWELSHSTVSKHVKTLEEQLGTQLLRRTSRTMVLTAEGQVVFEHSKRIGATFEEMTQRLDEMRGQVSGELRIASMVHVGQHIVQPAMAKFLAEYPQVRVTLMLDDGPISFYRQELDLAVRVGLPSEESLTARKLTDNDVCIAASPELLKRHGKPQHPSELAHYPTVAYASDSDEITSWSYLDAGEEKAVVVNPACLLNDGNSLLDAVRRGVGVGYLSSFAVWDDLETGSLVRLLPEFELPPYAPVYMLYAPSEYASPKLEAFKQQLVATVEGAR